MTSPQWVDKTQGEERLFGLGFTVLQDMGNSMVIYSCHFPPGRDIVLDWSNDGMSLSALEHAISLETDREQGAQE